MSRLRRLNNEVINHMLEDDEDGEQYWDQQNGMSFLPMDTAEQQEMIKKLELRNGLKNDKYLKVPVIATLLNVSTSMQAGSWTFEDIGMSKNRSRFMFPNCLHLNSHIKLSPTELYLGSYCNLSQKVWP
ncbi:unnamed protein product [Kluyveromyces dobzhanskii CBS 2104]|uniref:WGS project CCBQ000000000 data, contig 00009 n=1 Tax=Kluyveromyces dobzhanskii CBS 2104 TaxID=1427455 RepID=A0A0A8L3A0_9SACH|nr:unnamed protein product [Kluyveromyces dobzhanskii CBS 2104]